MTVPLRAGAQARGSGRRGAVQEGKVVGTRLAPVLVLEATWHSIRFPCSPRARRPPSLLLRGLIRRRR